MVGNDLNLFEYFPDSGRPLALKEICEKTNGEALFLSMVPMVGIIRVELLFTRTIGRYLSYLASIGVIEQTAKDEYAANNVTKNLAEKVSAATISHT